MFPPTRRSLESDTFDDWSGAPAAGKWATWFGGGFVPLLLLVYGAMCVVTRQGVLPGEHRRFNLEGPLAVAMGIAIVAAGMFLHLHYFWGNVRPTSSVPAMGKALALLAFIGGLGYVILGIAMDV